MCPKRVITAHDTQVETDDHLRFPVVILVYSTFIFPKGVTVKESEISRGLVSPAREDISILEFPVSGVWCPDSDILEK